MRDRSAPSSRANLRTEGLAWARAIPSSLEGVGAEGGGWLRAAATRGVASGGGGRRGPLLAGGRRCRGRRLAESGRNPERVIGCRRGAVGGRRGLGRRRR